MSTVVGDQREALMLQSEFNRHGLMHVAIDWTQPRKQAAVARLRRWFADGLLVIPEHERLRRELRGFTEKITPGGGLTFGARGSGHDDYVALLLTAAMADERNLLPGSPIGGELRFTMPEHVRESFRSKGRDFMRSQRDTDPPRRWY